MKVALLLGLLAVTECFGYFSLVKVEPPEVHIVCHADEKFILMNCSDAFYPLNLCSSDRCSKILSFREESFFSALGVHTSHYPKTVGSLNRVKQLVEAAQEPLQKMQVTAWYSNLQYGVQLLGDARKPNLTEQYLSGSVVYEQLKSVFEREITVREMKYETCRIRCKDEYFKAIKTCNEMKDKADREICLRQEQTLASGCYDHCLEVKRR